MPDEDTKPRLSAWEGDNGGDGVRDEVHKARDGVMDGGGRVRGEGSAGPVTVTCHHDDAC